MQTLEDRGSPRRRVWPVVVGVVAVVAVAAGVGYAVGHHGALVGSGSPAASPTTTTSTVPPLSVVSTTPANNSTGVAPDVTIEVHFSRPIDQVTAVPTLSPAVAGSWSQPDRTSLVFTASAPFIPSSTESVTLPAGLGGGGRRAQPGLAVADTIEFTVESGSTERLQQLLAEEGYLPLSFTPTGGAPPANEVADVQPGSFAWRWPMPASLTSLWSEGLPNVITQAAVMQFEEQNNLTVDGVAGPMVWTVLLKDAVAGATDPNSYNYVVVSKVLPENLTLYVNGNPQFTGIPVNTGAPGADTTDGTYPVFEHVQSSEMKGTNPDGTTYDDKNVPWASYFNGGDALHGFVRATYGSPQSNGCVEMSIADAQTLWPLTPVGTLVTITGPAVT
ncbi:MAG: L,D-transpeptidase family protein [Acidimicrobiales bacterium]